MFLDIATESAPAGEHRFAPSLCQRAKGVIANAIGARLREVFPLRDDENSFADLMAALELIPGRSLH